MLSLRWMISSTSFETHRLLSISRFSFRKSSLFWLSLRFISTKHSIIRLMTSWWERNEIWSCSYSNVYNSWLKILALISDSVTLLRLIRLWSSRNCWSIWNDHSTRYVLVSFNAVEHSDHSGFCRRAESWIEEAEGSVVSYLSTCVSLKSSDAYEWSECLCADALDRQSSERSRLDLSSQARVQSRNHVSHDQPS